MVVISSLPLCPPASTPSPTTASHPAASAFKPNLTEGTTCITEILFSFNSFVNILGLPADVKTIFIPSSTVTFTSSSTSVRRRGIFTPNGLSVAAKHFCMCSFNNSGFIEPEPISPKPPLFETADASFQPDTHIIPACTIGYLMFKSFVNFVSKVIIMFLSARYIVVYD